MQSTEAIRRKIQITNDLHSIVKTMKTLASVSIRQFENTVGSIAEYYRTVELGLQIVLKRLPRTLRKQKPLNDARIAVIIFGSDQGLCGPFNEHIASHFYSRMEKLNHQQENRIVLAVGSRVSPRIEDLGQSVEETYALPGTLSGLIPLVHELLFKMESWQSQEQLDQLFLFYNKPLSKSSYHPQGFRLLPLDEEWLEGLEKKKWPTNNLPHFTVDTQQLFSSLIRQYLSVCLFRALAESLMSENASRLAAMQAAEKNIEERLDDLNSQYQRERQNSITEELQDIMGGFEALMDKEKK